MLNMHQYVEININRVLNVKVLFIVCSLCLMNEHILTILTLLWTKAFIMSAVDQWFCPYLFGRSAVEIWEFLCVVSVWF